MDDVTAVGIMARLIKVGIGFDCALKIVNSMLLVRPDGEPLTIPDVITASLFNGEVGFMEAGATVSVLRRNGRAVIIDMPPLPMGTLAGAKSAKKTVRSSSGDSLVLLSDGVVASGDDWVWEMMTEWKGAVPQKLAKQAVSQAIKRRNNGHDNDITALVLSLNELKREL